MNDLLLRNARIWTGDARTPWADAALVRDGRFVFAGSAGDIDAPANVPTFDAGGRLVLPGLTDGHAHLLGTGVAMSSVDLKGVPSVAEAARRVSERVAATPSGAWVIGAGWDQHAWPGTRFPSRGDLDPVSPEHPVALTHTSGHAVWLNSAALRAAGITASTASPDGGRIELDDHGEPAGILLDAAAALVQGAMPRRTPDDRVEQLRVAAAHANSLGLTGVHAMEVGRGELTAMRSLRERGELSLRVRAYVDRRRLEEWFDEGLRTGDGDDVLRIGGVKFYADGALGSMTAWMLEPCEGTDDTGLAMEEPAALEQRVRSCFEHGLAPAVHAIGDRANREVLDILERARDLAPELPRRIEHAQLLAPADVERFGKLGVTASAQPMHATQDMDKVDRVWGERGRYAYAFASLLAGGANVAFGSDSPVETMDPLAGVHAAVTRRSADGRPDAGWYPDERISLEAALAAYTNGCAKAAGEAREAGRIAEGCYGDFVVLSDDLFALGDPMRILDVRVDATVVAGEIVYQR